MNDALRFWADDGRPPYTAFVRECQRRHGRAWYLPVGIAMTNKLLICAPYTWICGYPI